MPLIRKIGIVNHLTYDIIDADRIDFFLSISLLFELVEVLDCITKMFQVLPYYPRLSNRIYVLTIIIDIVNILVYMYWSCISLDWRIECGLTNDYSMNEGVVWHQDNNNLPINVCVCVCVKVWVVEHIIQTNPQPLPVHTLQNTLPFIHLFDFIE